MTEFSPLQALPLHIVESIVHYTLDTIERVAYVNTEPILFFLRSCRVFRQAYLKQACSTVYINEKVCRFTSYSSIGPFSYLQPPVPAYAHLVRTVDVDFWQKDLSSNDICGALEVLAGEEYSRVVFASARTLSVAIDIDDEYDDVSDDDGGDDGSDHGAVGAGLDSQRYLSVVRSVAALLARVRLMVPNAHTIDLRCSIYGRANGDVERPVMILSDLYKDIFVGIKNIGYHGGDEGLDPLVRLDPGLFPDLASFTFLHRGDGAWMFEVIRRSSGTLLRLDVKKLHRNLVQRLLCHDGGEAIVYPRLSVLVLEWNGCYIAVDPGYSVVHFPVLKKLTISNCFPVINKPFFNGSATLEYLDIGFRGAGSDPVQRFRIVDKYLRLDNLKTLRINCSHVHLEHLQAWEDPSVYETRFVQALLSMSSGRLRSLSCNVPYGPFSCLHLNDVLRDCSGLKNITRIDFGATKLSFSNFILCLKRAPRLAYFEFSPKSEKLVLKETEQLALESYPLNTSLVQITANHIHLYQNVDSLVNVVLLLVIACPRFAKLDVFSSLPYDHVKHMLVNLARTRHFSMYRDAIKYVSSRTKSFDLKPRYFGSS